MKKIFLTILAGIPLMMNAQMATDAYTLSQSDLRGTARFVSMAGAFGALGGDLSVLDQNPGGIGVYRSSDVGLTLNFDNQSSYARDGRSSNGYNQFKFTCSNAGYIGSYKLDSDIMPNINWGFTYSRPVSFNRRYTGNFNQLNTSMFNYIAGVTTAGNWNTKDLAYGDTYNPYRDSNAPWLSILSYNSYAINPTSFNNGIGSNFVGLLGTGTSGRGEFETIEEGGVDQFNLDWGGNLANILYWGMGFGITDMNYKKYTYYGEALNNAYVSQNDGSIVNGSASYGLENWVRTTGTGYNFKMGVIFKPINEFRLGLAFHTPTYWSLKDEAFATMNYEYRDAAGAVIHTGKEQTNDGYNSEVWYRVHTPWRLIASAAAVIGRSAILSFDYEYVGYNNMKVLSDNGNEYTDVTTDIKSYYQASNIFRIGGEYRVTPQFSLRAGYSYMSSPVKNAAYNNELNIVTAGTTPAYSFDNTTQYYTCGMGYKYKSFYTDLALVHKYRQSEYHPFSPVVNNGSIVENAPIAKIHDHNNQIVWSMGIRF